MRSLAPGRSSVIFNRSGPASLYTRGRFWISLMMVQGIDVGILAKHDPAAVRAEIELADAQRRGHQSQRGNREQVLGGHRQQAEAVDHFHLQIAQFGIDRGALAMRLYSVSRVCTSPR